VDSGTGVSPKLMNFTYNALDQFDVITRYNNLTRKDKGTQLIVSYFTVCPAAAAYGPTPIVSPSARPGPP